MEAVIDDLTKMKFLNEEGIYWNDYVKNYSHEQNAIH